MTYSIPLYAIIINNTMALFFLDDFILPTPHYFLDNAFTLCRLPVPEQENNNSLLKNLIVTEFDKENPVQILHFTLIQYIKILKVGWASHVIIKCTTYYGTTQ
jgi:hypothetical protein